MGELDRMSALDVVLRVGVVIRDDCGGAGLCKDGGVGEGRDDGGGAWLYGN